MTESRVTDDEATDAPRLAQPRGEVAGGGWRLGLLIAASLAVAVMAGKGWIVTLTFITVMIFLHELGHYLTAKWSGMKVTEFFLFFGPKLWSFRRGETEYGIKLIPVGAYVRIIGMNNLDECPPEDEPRTFRQQSYPKRLLVVSAGSLMHFLQAFVLFFVAFALLGVSPYTEQAERLGVEADDSAWQIEEVTPDSAADAAGLRPGDRITNIDGQPVDEFADVGALIEGRVGDTLPIVVARGERVVELTATIGHHEGEPDSAFLGIARNLPDLPAVTATPVRSVVVAGEFTVSTIRSTVVSLGRFFTGGVDDFASSVIEGGSDGRSTGSGSAVSGGEPASDGDENRLVSIYGVARIGAEVSEEGMSPFLMLFAFVNVAIGVLNLIPLLPLDGGHVAVATYERIRSIGGRRHMADVSRLLPFTYAVFMLLVLIGVSSIYLDIVDPVGLG